MFQLLFVNRITLNPGQGGVRDVSSVIISHEQTQSNRVCCFQTLDFAFQRSLFRLFSDHNSYRCALLRPYKVSPYIDKVLFCLDFFYGHLGS